MQTGCIKSIFMDRGFGFIRRDDGQGDVFMHARNVQGLPWETLDVGDLVDFEVADPYGKGPRAVNVTYHVTDAGVA